MKQVVFLALVVTAVVCFAAAAPQNPLQCGDGEAAYPCGDICELNCSEKLPDICKGIECKTLSCRCKNGLARNSETGLCVPIEECLESEHARNLRTYCLRSQG